jgi:hypothetical protein
MVQEELNRGEALQEAVEGPGYVIKAWDNPESKKGIPSFDSAKAGKKYETYDAVIDALKSSELSEKGAYEITWVKSGTKVE